MRKLSIDWEITEKKLTNQIIDQVNAYDKSQVLVYKRFSGYGNENGKPDLTGVAFGTAIELEIKKPSRVVKKSTRELLIKLDEMFWSEKIKLDLIGFSELFWSICEETHEIASAQQRLNIKKFRRAGAISGVVVTLTQALVAIMMAEYLSKYSEGMKLALGI